jgi:inhibitor of cysteine peptidase
MNERVDVWTLTRVALVLLAATAAACLSEDERGPKGSDDAPKKVVLTKDDDGGRATLRPGQTLVVRLAGNPTTGYRWEVGELKGKAIEQVGEAEYVPDEAPEGRVGVGGTFIFTFRAVEPGRCAFRLVYRRPWEKGKKPARTFSAAVEVKRDVGE